MSKFGKISDQLEKIPSEKIRAQMKTTALASLARPTDWESDGVRFKVVDGPQASAGFLEVEVHAYRIADGRELPLDDNRLQFYNPPILIRDSQGKLREDPETALRQMIERACRAYWQQRGIAT